MENYFTPPQEQGTVDAYIENSKTSIPEIFPVERVIQMKIFQYHGKFYFRTRDAAALLGIKQPFQFTADCKEMFGPNAILKGEKTRTFRNPDDSDVVTFIEAHDLLHFLTSDATKYRHKYLPEMYISVVEALRNMLK